MLRMVGFPEKGVRWVMYHGWYWGISMLLGGTVRGLPKSSIAVYKAYPVKLTSKLEIEMATKVALSILI